MLNIKSTTSAGGCKVVRTADQLNDDDRATFLAAINDPETWTAYSLDIELRRRGIVCTNDTIMAHRRGVCKCQT